MGRACVLSLSYHLSCIPALKLGRVTMHREPGLTSMECCVQKRIIKEQAPSFSPALRFSSHHQLTIVGGLQTCRRRWRQGERELKSP